TSSKLDWSSYVCSSDLKVRHPLPDFGADHPGHKVGDGTGRIEFASRPGALQLLQDGLVNLAESVAFLVVVQVQLVNGIDDLPQQDAVLHIVVGVGKGGLDNGLADGGIGIHRQVFQRREQGVVDKIQQFVAGHLFS